MGNLVQQTRWVVRSREMESDELPDAADASDWDTDELFSDDGDIDEFSDWDCDMDSDSDQETRAYRTPRDLGRQEWAKRVDSLYDHEFKRFYRTPRGLFHGNHRTQGIANRLRSRLERHSKHASTLRGGAVVAEMKLGIALRYLSGGSYLDIAMTHGVCPTSVNRIVDQVLDAMIAGVFRTWNVLWLCVLQP